jgi:hypothetical protein
LFGYFKKLREELIATQAVSRGLAEIIKQNCGRDFLGEFSNSQRNLLADDVLKKVTSFHGVPFYAVDFVPFGDIFVTGFLMLAKKIGPHRGLDHMIVLMGLMKFIDLSHKKKI